VLRALAALPLAAALAVAAPLPGIPSYAQGYARWTKLNRAPIPPRASDPHRSYKNVYASKLPRGNRYPVGTVIVKEGRATRSGYVRLIAVMRKVKAVGPNNGWTMIEWSRSSPGARFTELARGQVCYSCHVGARRTDYVFTKRR
jgi:Cytochrome P460